MPSHSDDSTTAPPLRMVAWELTQACNLACRHCRAAAVDTPGPDEFSTDECLALLDHIAAFASPTIILTGGEPLLRPDFFTIAEHARDAGLRAVAAVNGLLLDRERATHMLDAGIRRISISIDGKDAAQHDRLRAVPGAFEGALRGVQAATDAALPFQINTTVTTENADDLPEIFQLAVRLGAVAHHVFLLVPTGRAAEAAGLELDAQRYEEVLSWLAEQHADPPIEIRATCAPHYYRIIRQRGVPTKARGCLAGQAFCFISHKGDVQPCGYFDYACGNVRETPLRTLWETAPLFQQFRKPDDYHGKCGLCEYRRVCGGCRARAYAATGDALGPEPLCAYVPHACQ
jgi:heme b synthase